MARSDHRRRRDTDGGEPPGWTVESPTVAVAEAIAEAAGLDATELAPLYGSIDTEAMDDLLTSAADARLTFTHRGYEVTVSGAGEVSVSGPAE